MLNLTKEQPTGLLFDNENGIYVVVNKTFLIKLDMETNTTTTVFNTTDVTNLKEVKAISQDHILVNDAKVGLIVIDMSDLKEGSIEDYLSLP